MGITKERLETYRSEKQEIKELKCKLQALKIQDYTGVDTILDYRSGFPIPKAVVGTDIDSYWGYKEYLQSRITGLTTRCQEVERWIEEIPDSQIRRIFRMYFIEGLSMGTVGKRTHLDKSSVSRKIEKFLKLQQMQQMQRYNKN